MVLEAEKARLEEEVLAMERNTSVVDLHPGAVELYSKAVADLREALGHGDRRQEAAALIRNLVERIEVIPGTVRGDFTLRVHGRLAELCNPDHLARRTAWNQAGTRTGEAVVAGEGFEPPTLGL